MRRRCSLKEGELLKKPVEIVEEPGEPNKTTNADQTSSNNTVSSNASTNNVKSKTFNKL